MFFFIEMFYHILINNIAPPYLFTNYTIDVMIILEAFCVVPKHISEKLLVQAMEPQT